jgi:hypothetical protein
MNQQRFQHLEKIARKEGFPATVIVRHLIHRFLDQENKLYVSGQQRAVANAE